MSMLILCPRAREISQLFMTWFIIIYKAVFYHIIYSSLFSSELPIKYIGTFENANNIRYYDMTDTRLIYNIANVFQSDFVTKTAMIKRFLQTKYIKFPFVSKHLLLWYEHTLKVQSTIIIQNSWNSRQRHGQVFFKEPNCIFFLKFRSLLEQRTFRSFRKRNIRFYECLGFLN